MSAADILARQGRRLLQIGVALLLFTSFWGFAIAFVAAPQIGLSVHTLSGLQAVLLLALGLVWPRLTLGVAAARFAFWLLLYSASAILAAYIMASFWGAGNETLPLVAGTVHGSPMQESTIKALFYSSAIGIIAFALILWGLRADWGPASGQ
jgi:hydroxylaminobenzene mutase